MLPQFARFAWDISRSTLRSLELLKKCSCEAQFLQFSYWRDDVGVERGPLQERRSRNSVVRVYRYSPRFSINSFETGFLSSLTSLAGICKTRGPRSPVLQGARDKETKEWARGIQIRLATFVICPVPSGTILCGFKVTANAYHGSKK